MRTTDLASSTPWVKSLRASRERRLEAMRARRRRRRRRGAGTAGVVLATMTLASAGAVAHQTTAKPAASDSTRVSSGTLKTGSRGRAVAALQKRLGLAADGVFGPATRRAVKRFQRRKGLTVDGVAGPQTLRALGLRRSGTRTTSPRSRAPRSNAPRSRAPRTRSVSRRVTRSSAVAAARSRIGAPYRWGGTGPSSFDCSGLVQWSMRKSGVSLPRTSAAMYERGRAIAKSEIRKGDLVFFDTSGPGASHVGIATSSSTVISTTTRGVLDHPISDSYWGSHYVGARRV